MPAQVNIIYRNDDELVTAYNINGCPVLVHEKHHTDKYQNEVTVFEFPDRKFNMINHYSRRRVKGGYADYSTIYHSRGKFVRVRCYYPDNDCSATTCEVGKYKQFWGDGEALGAYCDSAGPDVHVTRELLNIHEDTAAFIALVLMQISNIDACWETKEVRENHGQ